MKSELSEFDLQLAHKHFSANCFNQAWKLIDTAERTAEEDEAMIRLSQASIWHWTQRDDCTDTNLSIGYWQASRIYSLLGQQENARRYGRLCLEHSEEAGPFFVGYAYEALARAALLAGDREDGLAYLERAHELAEEVSEPDDRKLLMDDLASLA